MHHIYLRMYAGSYKRLIGVENVVICLAICEHVVQIDKRHEAKHFHSLPFLQLFPFTSVGTTRDQRIIRVVLVDVVVASDIFILWIF